MSYLGLNTTTDDHAAKASIRAPSSADAPD